MVPPHWPDEQGRPIPIYPWPGCGLEVASRSEASAWRICGAWAGCSSESKLNRCGHGREIIPLSLPAGHVTFVPMREEAK